jgi:hypothetical protein
VNKQSLVYTDSDHIIGIGNKKKGRQKKITMYTHKKLQKDSAHRGTKKG